MFESALLGALAIVVCFQETVPPSTARGGRPIETTPAQFHLDYPNRHAVVIGIDKYEDASFPRLSYAVADAKAVAELLIKQFGFKSENVSLLVNEQATTAGIRKELMERLSNPTMVGDDDLVVVFFAGHGETQDTHRGKRGFLVPVDGQRDRSGTPEWATLLGMWDLEKASEAIPAKHALFLLDCCFGGLVSDRSATPLTGGLNRRARQIITAGGEKQTVLDGGAEGHSIFTAALLDGMNGLADANADHIITFSELWTYVDLRVESETSMKQIPEQKHFADDEGGSVALFAPGIKPVLSSAQERLRQLQLDKDALLSEVERLSDLVTVEKLEKSAAELWPRRPGKIPDYRSWLGEARTVKARLPEHEQALRRIQQEAFLSQVVAGLIEEKESSQVIWEKAAPGLRQRFGQFSDLVQRARALEPLIADIESRLEVAGTIDQKTIREQTDAWNAARDAIAKNPLYHGLVLEPQIGLLPLGPDPESKLWEFWVWESGERPVREENTKRWKITGETGVVLILLPGRTFTMGAQKELPLSPNYDTLAIDDESPVHEVTLVPFFLSKYEMTQGQWSRIAGKNPSYFKHAGRSNADAYPVEQVSYDECVQMLGRLALTLPTEAQWEYGARAGTTTPWWTGSARESLEEAANLADESYRRAFSKPLPSESWDDGYEDVAPVGMFKANGFGFHDTAGNVWEWYRDWFASYTLPVQPGDGERIVTLGARVNRGGSFKDPARLARAAARPCVAPVIQSGNLGVRPSRSLAP